MNIALWVVQVLLVLLFLMFGSMKLMRSKEQLVETMVVLRDFSQGQIRAVGIVEVLGALGLILPAVTGILPILTPLAAIGLALDMAVASIVHLRRQEYSFMIVTLVLFTLAVFVAYGRFVLEPF